jgi:hypothetical protein
MPGSARRSVGTQTSSGAALVAVVQPADLGNSDNLARRGRLHRAWPGTILVQGKMCSRLIGIVGRLRVRAIAVGRAKFVNGGSWRVGDALERFTSTPVTALPGSR